MNCLDTLFYHIYFVLNKQLPIQTKAPFLFFICFLTNFTKKYFTLRLKYTYKFNFCFISFLVSKPLVKDLINLSHMTQKGSRMKFLNVTSKILMLRP